MVKIKRLKTQGQSTLVEWVDGNNRNRRGFIPTDQIEVDQTSWETLDLAIPFGSPWAEMFGDVVIPADTLEAELYRRGVWDHVDLLNKPNEVLAAVSAVNGITLGKLIERSKEQANG